jgi:methionine-gamma-lyase
MKTRKTIRKGPAINTRKKNSPQKLSIAGRSIHGDRLYAYTGPVTTPIYQTSTYRFSDSRDAVRYAKGDPSVYVYTRYHNPTTDGVEKKIALLYGADSAALFSSGMAAITTAVLSYCRQGTEIVSTPALYGGTYRFFRDTLPDFGITTRYIDADSFDDLPYVITNRTRLVYLESPTNPTLGLVDVRKLVAHTRRLEKEFGRPIVIMMDNTFATIINQDPFALGVDVVVESSTKYLGGHTDIMGGVLVGGRALIKKARDRAKHFGGCADPFASFLLERSLKTFELRVGRQVENAMKLARALEKHSTISRVLYPGLPSHPQHALAKKQMTGFGAMVTAEVRGGVKAAVKVCDNLRVAVNAMSLGGVETLVSIPVYSSHINMSREELARHGVTPGMIRISVGVEGADDLIADFRQALKRV